MPRIGKWIIHDQILNGREPDLYRSGQDQDINMKRTGVVSLSFLTLFVLTAHADKQADRLYAEAIRLHGSARLEEVFSLYTQAAELGNAVAQYNVAMMYANGEGVNVDYQQAVYWFKKSAGQQFAPAQFRLGELYFFGMGGLPEETKTAGRLFKAAAEQGDPDAQVNLAILLGTGQVFPLDRERALYWLAQAIEAGHESAHYYNELLLSSESGRLGLEAQESYWKQQKNYWVEMAAEYGVREAREAIERPSGEGH
ncbi:MAG: tetratricopeptide repeat protein [Xanthomonadales bacterium]|nr:tetratricopeptide repeat protein [Xanthomonadales bacterium]